MSNINVENFGAFGIVVGVVGVGYGWWKAKKADEQMRALAKKLDTTVENLEKKTTVDIQDDIINKAIEKTVDREVKKNVENTVKQLKDKMDKEIENDVRKEVSHNLNTIKEDVASTISLQVAEIDEDALRKTVEKQAADRVVNKHDKDLEKSIERFNEKANKALEKFKEDIEEKEEKCDERIGEMERSCKKSIETVTRLHDGVVDALGSWRSRLGGGGLNLRLGD